jgi:hypothetical protein
MRLKIELKKFLLGNPFSLKLLKSCQIFYLNTKRGKFQRKISPIGNYLILAQLQT